MQAQAKARCTVIRHDGDDGDDGDGSSVGVTALAIVIPRLSSSNGAGDADFFPFLLPEGGVVCELRVVYSLNVKDRICGLAGRVVRMILDVIRTNAHTVLSQRCSALVCPRTSVCPSAHTCGTHMPVVLSKMEEMSK